MNIPQKFLVALAASLYLASLVVPSRGDWGDGLAALLLCVPAMLAFVPRVLSPTANGGDLSVALMLIAFVGSNIVFAMNWWRLRQPGAALPAWRKAVAFASTCGAGAGLVFGTEFILPQGRVYWPLLVWTTALVVMAVAAFRAPTALPHGSSREDGATS